MTNIKVLKLVHYGRLLRKTTYHLWKKTNSRNRIDTPVYKIAKGEKKSRTLVIFSIFVRKLHSEVGEQDYVLHCVRLRAGHLDTRLYTQYYPHLVTTM